MVENINIKSSKITGVFGHQSKDFIWKIYNGKILINNKLNHSNMINYNPFFYTNTIIDEFKYYFKNIKTKDIQDYLDKYQLTPFLHKNINELSFSEKYIIYLLIMTKQNKDIYIFEDIFQGLDYNYKKIIKTIIRQLKFDNKIIILESQNIDLLNEIIDDIIILDNKKVLIQGNLDEIYEQKMELLIKNNVDIPKMAMITYKALQEKNIKLFYHHDVRDIIKDIYKHV